MLKNKLIITVLFFLIIIINVSCLAIEPISTIKYQGMDISNWQGKIDFESVSRSGIEIVYIKSSQGEEIDPYFEKNYTEAKENNLKVGVYHFVTARNIMQAQNEAIFFSNLVKEKAIDCKLAMDFEVFENLTNEEINNISKIFLETVEKETGKDVIIYSDLYNATNTFSSDLANKYSVWIAYYGNYTEIENVPTNWSYWEGIQYMDKGIIPGIEGYVDRDYFTPEIFLKDVPEYMSVHIENQEEYIVKKGDTLSRIANIYNTSVENIVRINDIKNENLIFPGEKFEIIKNTNVENTSNHLGHIEYKVKKGDTLFKIAFMYNTSIEEIAKLNDIKNVNLIYTNEILRIKI